MKTFIFSVCLLLVSFAYAQNRIFTHTATAETLQDGYTYIDHPMLNDNPNAKIILTHNWNPGGVGGVLNNKRSGVFYNSGNGRWAIYNEDMTVVTPNCSYNVYINYDDEVIVVAASTIDPPNNFLEFDHPLVNGNPDAMLGVQTYWNPNQLVNDKTYGFEYIDGTWYIYNEGFSEIPQGAAFFVLINGVGVQNHRHFSSNTNTNGNGTTIDHPLLNNNPDAVFIISHIYGVDGAEADINAQLSVYYSHTEEKWIIYREDLNLIPVNAAFNLFIYDSSLNTEEITTSEVKLYPNPVKDILNINSEQPIETVQIYNVAGEIVFQQRFNSNSEKLNLSNLPKGVYILKLIQNKKIESFKIIKN